MRPCTVSGNSQYYSYIDAQRRFQASLKLTPKATVLDVGEQLGQMFGAEVTD